MLQQALHAAIEPRFLDYGTKEMKAIAKEIGRGRMHLMIVTGFGLVVVGSQMSYVKSMLCSGW